MFGYTPEGPGWSEMSDRLATRRDFVLSSLNNLYLYFSVLLMAGKQDLENVSLKLL